MGGQKVEIEKGMNQVTFFRYAKTDEFEVVELPYEDNNFNMYIFLPNEKSIKNINNLAAEFDPSQFKNSLKKEKIRLKMPAFDATVETDLIEVLKKMGIKDAFDDNANFFKITDENIMVSKAKTKTVVKVDEEGSEAAAVAVAIL